MQSTESSVYTIVKAAANRIYKSGNINFLEFFLIEKINFYEKYFRKLF